MIESYRVDYLTERETKAIRCNAFSLGSYDLDICRMTIRFRDPDGIVEIPHDVVQQFMCDWRKSGAWSLHGRDEKNAA